MMSRLRSLRSIGFTLFCTTVSSSDSSKQCVAPMTTCSAACSSGSAPERLSASSRSNAAARSVFCASAPSVECVGALASSEACAFLCQSPAGAMMVARSADSPPSRDLTKVPGELDRQYEKLDVDAALRATVIAPSGDWTRRAPASILSRTRSNERMGGDAQKAARTEAFDLLDALSRSGALPMRHAALHVVMGATHCFDESLLDTVVQRNANPIEKCERSLLIMASTLHGKPAAQLVRPEHVARLAAQAPGLFAAASVAPAIDE